MGRINFQQLEQETVVKLPEGGTIAKGSPQKPWIDKKTGQPYTHPDGTPKLIQGDDLDYFRLVPSPSLHGVDFDGRQTAPGEGDMAEAMMQRWEDVYGPEPRSLNILFLGAHIKDVFKYGNQDWRKPKGGGKGFLVRECDGTRILKERQQTPKGFQLFFDPTDERGNFKRCACLDEAGNEIHQDCPLGCSAKASLTVVLPDLGIPRQFTFRTGALNDIREIMRNLRPHDGLLHTTPFRLVRTQREVLHRQADGSMMPVKKWLIHVELASSSGMHFLQAQQQRRFQALEGQTLDVQALPVSSLEFNPQALELGPSADTAEWYEEDALPEAGDQRAYMMPPSPQPSQLNLTALANTRASAVAEVRKAAGVSAQRVKELLADYPRKDGKPQAPTHPAHLSQEDYEDLILRIEQEEGQEQQEDQPQESQGGLEESWESV